MPAETIGGGIPCSEPERSCWLQRSRHMECLVWEVKALAALVEILADRNQTTAGVMGESEVAGLSLMANKVGHELEELWQELFPHPA